MNRAARALVLHELAERTRDRWVLVISVLFVLLASAVSLYGRSLEADAATLTGPSLVTLASLLVPLVALVLGHDAICGEAERNTLGLLLSLPISRTEVVLGKFGGRLLALGLAVGLGLGAAILLSGEGHRAALLALMLPTCLLGATFLALGLLVSTVVQRQVTAASLVIAIWFLLVFFYDLGLLALLVATDGAVAGNTVTRLVVANPVGLFRLAMMDRFAGPSFLENMGLSIEIPGSAGQATLWALWVLVPVVTSSFVLWRRKVMR